MYSTLFHISHKTNNNLGVRKYFCFININKEVTNIFAFVPKKFSENEKLTMSLLYCVVKLNIPWKYKSTNESGTNVEA